MFSHHQIRRKFIDFFVKRGHLEIPSASLLPEYDPTLLLTNSGMAPLKPYFLGVKKPPASRLVNAQKCVRTGDIESVGDIHHLTFFEMLGNWSVGRPGFSDFKKEGEGPYFKNQACEFALDLVREFGLDENRLYFGTFGGDSSLPDVRPDEETKRAWLSLGVRQDRILDLTLEDSFWFSGPTGPCGPNTDVIYDLGEAFACGQKECGLTHDCGRFLEIWNAGVFMMYNRSTDGSLEEMPLKSVDAGAGLERFTLVLQGGKSVYETDLFGPQISQIRDLAQISSDNVSERSIRIIADHIRAATFLAADGLAPANTEAGYVLRRLLRRAVAHGRLLKIDGFFVSQLAQSVIENFQESYPSLGLAEAVVHQVLEDEEERFGKVMKRGLSSLEREMEKSSNKVIKGEVAFRLYDSLGLPLEIIIELCQARGFEVEQLGFQKNLKEQKERARTARAKENYDPEKIRTAHTAAHLLNAALKKVLGSQVHQRGQKIEVKTFRHDFNFGRKLSADEISQVEDLVNLTIQKNLSVAVEKTTFEKARGLGAEALFEEKYQSVEAVTIYRIGPDPSAGGEYFSQELCGGPHASSTGPLKRFKIIKEEAVSSGVRRIRGVVEG